MSMTLQEAAEQVHQVVSFKAHVAARTEFGVITEVRKSGVMVLFTGDRSAKHVNPLDIKLIPAAWARTHHRDTLDHFKAVMSARVEEQA